jgi:hypothetical protein
MSAHSAAPRSRWVSTLVAQISDYVFEPVVETVETVRIEPHPVVAVVSAAPKSGATTLARLLAAELASRADGAAVVAGTSGARRHAPPSRAALRLATAMAGTAGQACGRLCLSDGVDARVIANTTRYLAPVVLDLRPDGSAAESVSVADRVVVVGCAASEPALLDAVASVLGGDPLKVVNRCAADSGDGGRTHLVLPESRIAARAAGLGTRALGPLGSAIADLADALGADQ